MRSTLALLLLFGAVIGTSATECVPYTLPTKGKCEYTVDWKVNDDKHALATCLEYFPTTFVEGKRDKTSGKAKCTVTAAYTCAHLKSVSDVLHSKVFLMYDKCYIFPKENGKYVKGKIADYNKPDGLCKGGKLSVFYSYTHAKFLGMKAHTEKIEKLWIGITSEGKMIEKPHTMMHKQLWKLVEGDYWEGDKLIKVTNKTKDEKYIYPKEAEYFFMRTRTDYVMNRIQGSFERTTKDMEATFACEFESKFTAEQEWYCTKMSALGIDAVYDDDANERNCDKNGECQSSKPEKDRKPRCLYVTAGSYTYNGNSMTEAVADMKNIKGCQERPSDLHSAGMDDGTGDPVNYGKLRNKGPLRIAASVLANIAESRQQQPKCNGPVTSGRDSLFRKWRHYEHNGKIQLPASALISWDSKYPLNECSDFPGDSTTMGLKNGKKIDMPPEVRAQAVCSLKFFQECENRKPCDSKLECENTSEFQPNADPKKAGFFKCKCPGEEKDEAFDAEKDTNGNIINCKWKPGEKFCARLKFVNPIEPYFFEAKGPMRWLGDKENDKLYELIVRDGCKITVRSHGVDWEDGYQLLTEATYGTHIVPHPSTGTLGAEFIELAASAAQCWCN